VPCVACQIGFGTWTDHITPRSKADRFGYVTRDGVRMPVNDKRNLQALCFRCNRAKRDTEAIDYRRSVDTTSMATESNSLGMAMEALIDAHTDFIDTPTRVQVEKMQQALSAVRTLLPK
jgi:hypothetical protein